jgi:signal transduction histidine kinase/ActR/RegA family two-component response regulator
MEPRLDFTAPKSTDTQGPHLLPPHGDRPVLNMKPESPRNQAPTSLSAYFEQAELSTTYVEGAAHIVGYANPAFCRLVGKPAEQLLGRPLAEVLPEQIACMTMLGRVYRTAQPESHSEQQHSKPRLVFWSYVMWPVLANGRPEGVMVQVTERAQLLERTIAMNESLILGSVRQHELTEAAQTAAALARQADVRKNDFLAILAHELRNPLAPIRSMLEVMKRADGDGALLRPALEAIERQVTQMTRLIDDLLDVSRISRDKLRLREEDVELATVIHDVIESTRSVCESTQIDLTVTLPPHPVYLRADPARLAQVFGNLLNNACKFTKPGGHISLVAQRRGSDVVVTVKDSGIGVAPAMLPKIFEMFTQADQTLERSRGGLGIGLSLVQRLVKMHGGSVQALSEGVDQGSEFVVRLPALARTPQEASPGLPAGEAPSITAHRILVVDDNHDAADALATLLKISGNETELAFDGEEAVSAAEKFRPDVILMDIGMPKLNGYRAASEIRHHAWGKDMVLVALTGWGQDEDRKKTAAAGFDGHLVKPVDYAALAKVVNRLTNGHAPSVSTATAVVQAPAMRT